MPDTPVIAGKSAPQPYIPKPTPKGGKKNDKAAAAAAGTPQPPPVALSQQIHVVPPVAPPPCKIKDLRFLPGGTPKKGGRAWKQSVTAAQATTPGTPQPQKFIQQKASPVVGQAQQVATIKFDGFTGQLLQPELCPVVSQSHGAKIHGLPQAATATSVAPIPPIKVNPGLVHTVQSVTTKMHALPVPSSSTATGITAQRPQVTRQFGSPTKETPTQPQQPISAAEILQHQQAISQMIGVPVQFNGATQTFQVVPQAQTAGVAGTQEKTSSTHATAESASSQAQVLAGKQKKQGAAKKPMQTYGRRQVESPKPKPTATIKPTMSDDEAGSAKLRQALQTPYEANNVVHLVPIENIDGSVTYLVVQLDDTGSLRIDSTEGPMMTQTPPDAIFIDKATNGQRILKALTQPAPNPPAIAPAVVTQPQVMVRQQPQTVSQAMAQQAPQPVAIAPAPAPVQPQPIAPAPAPAQNVPVQTAVPQTVQPLPTQTQQIYIQRNGDGSQVQLAPAETLEAGASGEEAIQVQLQVTGDGTQQMMTLEEVLSQGQGQVQYEPQQEYLAYEEAMHQVQMGDGTIIDLSQFAGGGEHQILFLQEDGTLIDPASLGIDISQFMQAQPTEPN